MHRGHVRGRRGRELRRRRGDVQALDERVIAMTLEELQPERVQHDQDHPLARVDAPLDLGRDVGEALRYEHSRRFAATGRSPAGDSTLTVIASTARLSDSGQSIRAQLPVLTAASRGMQQSEQAWGRRSRMLLLRVNPEAVAAGVVAATASAWSPRGSHDPECRSSVGRSKGAVGLRPADRTWLLEAYRSFGGAPVATGLVRGASSPATKKLSRFHHERVEVPGAR